MFLYSYFYTKYCNIFLFEAFSGKDLNINKYFFAKNSISCAPNKEREAEK